ncbi:hypothetical protein BDN70DRAFT_885256 [Pholiota conissans]|uniref:Uncharacterized protein n=1 Tax=Pholiota conissans TaxID=109636 RepID=A0A9P5YUJ3_9AGAR|nr:hypothetical protein BDN70DRAFT_885256 [Pholiota conissans]
MDDLLSLGRVTSTFAEEADRIISYVKLLRLFMPPQTQFDPNDVTLLARTLSQLKNLRVLRVAPDEPGAYKDAILRRLATPSKGEAVNGWILEGHPFELEGFENTYFGADTLVHFVNQQPKLKTLN